MTTAIKRRRGTTAQHATFTGLEGEITVDTTKDTLVVHDGATAGGFPLAKENNPTFTGSATFSSGTANGVAYLNGSKVLTTGSALTFDGTNIGVGTSSPSSYGKFAVTGSLGTVSVTDNGAQLDFSRNAENYIRANGASASLCFNTNSSERMRIDSSGNLLVGTTSAGGSGGLTITPNGQGANTPAISKYNKTASGNFYAQQFLYNGTLVGDIEYSNTATAYVTTSDHRLKENVQPMVGALTKVLQLNPVTYTWKADGSDGQGFIAHELQAVVPDCVTGEKDAVDAEGNPVYQGIDTSFLVATLTKAIQEQQEQINQLKAEVASLKGA